MSNPSHAVLTTLKLDNDTVRISQLADGLLRVSVPDGPGKWRTHKVYGPSTPVAKLFWFGHAQMLLVTELRKTNTAQAKHITDLTAKLVAHGLWP